MSVKHFKKRLMIVFCLIVSLCLLLITGAELTIASSNPAISLCSSGKHNNPGSLTVQGRWKYINRDYYWEYTDRFRVQLLNATDPDPSNPLDETQTDSNGYFELSTDNNPGVVRIQIYSYAEFSDDIVMVVDKGGSDWKTDAYNVFEDRTLNDGTYNLGELKIDTYYERRASWIKSDLQDSFDFPPQQVGCLKARWPDNLGWGLADRDFYCYCEEIFTDFPCGEGFIYLVTDTSANSREGILHESGHAIMDHVYDGQMPYTCGSYLANCFDHEPKKKTDQRCAWMEGWADFWAALVNRNPNLPSYSLETPTWGKSDWDNGDDVEGRVAGALWDIYDSGEKDNADQYCDQYDDRPYITWETFCDQSDDTFEEFWENWQVKADTMGRSTEIYGALRSIYQNTIVYCDGYNVNFFSTVLGVGFNLISMPLVPRNPTCGTMMLSLDFIQVAQYVADGHDTVDDWYLYNPPPAPSDLYHMPDSWGYWVNMNTAGTLGFYGYQDVPTYYTLCEGWNLIGFTSMVPKLPADYLTSIACKYGTIYGFDNGGYFIVGTSGHEQLQPGFGYWIAIFEPAILIYPAPGRGGSRSGTNIFEQRDALLAKEGTWNISLNVTTNRNMSNFGGLTPVFGIHPKAVDSYDRILDIPAPPLPPITEGVEAYLWSPENDSAWQRKLSTDYTPPADSITWILKVRYMAAERTEEKITISWDAAEVVAVPQEYTLLLLDEKGKELANMREVSSHTFSVKIPVEANSTTITFQIQAERQ